MNGSSNRQTLYPKERRWKRATRSLVGVRCAWNSVWHAQTNGMGVAIVAYHALRASGRATHHAVAQLNNPTPLASRRGCLAVFAGSSIIAFVIRRLATIRVTDRRATG